MRFEVLLTAAAREDLDEIVEYVAAHDSAGKATQWLDRIEQALAGIADFPEKGSHPKELLDLGIREYRQAFFKPYRMIYRIIGKRAFVLLIADGRRDMQSLLSRRLLGAD